MKLFKFAIWCVPSGIESIEVNDEMGQCLGGMVRSKAPDLSLPKLRHCSCRYRLVPELSNPTCR